MCELPVRRYVIVKESSCHEMRFSRFHQYRDEALEEARRLARKERGSNFLILRVIGQVRVELEPLKEEIWEKD